MPCTVLPRSVELATALQNTGKTVNPRGVWNPRFFGLPQCKNLPMMGNIEDDNWMTVEENIRLGVPAVQNVWPGFALQPYTGPGPPPAGGAGPSLEVRSVPQPFSNSPTAMLDAALQMNLFVDECVLYNAYGPTNPWVVNSIANPSGCTYAYVTIAPMGTATTTGRGGVQVLNACPIIVAELEGIPSAGPIWGAIWWQCNYTINFPGGGSFTYNLCPTGNPGAGYTPCPSVPPAPAGNTRMIRAVNMTPGAFTWMRGQQFRTQVHYLIPNINNSTQHLYVASQIETKQVL